MNYSYINNNYTFNYGGTGSSQPNIAVNYTPTAGNFLYIVVGYENSSSIVLSGASNIYSNVNLETGFSGTSLIQTFYVESCAGGSTTFTATFGTPALATDTTFIQVNEYSGIGSLINTASAALNSPGTTADAISSGNVNVTSQPAVLIGYGVIAFYNSMVSGTGFTNRSSTYNFLLEDKSIIATGNASATFTDSTNGSSDAYIALGAAFQLPTSTPPSSMFLTFP